jgi:HEAT repeats
MNKKIWCAVAYAAFPIAIFTAALINREPRYHGKTALKWIDELRLNPDASLDALRHMGPAAVPALKNGLKSLSATHRCRSAWVLGRFGPEAKDAVPELIRALDDRRPGVQQEAMASLSHIGITNEDIVRQLQSKLTVKIIDGFAATLLDSIERERKANNLIPVPGDQFDYDMAFLKSPTRSVRTYGVIKLAALARQDERAKTALQALSSDRDLVIRLQAEKLMKNATAITQSRLIAD